MASLSSFSSWGAFVSLIWQWPTFLFICSGIWVLVERIKVWFRSRHSVASTAGVTVRPQRLSLAQLFDSAGAQNSFKGWSGLLTEICVCHNGQQFQLTGTLDRMRITIPQTFDCRVDKTYLINVIRKPRNKKDQKWKTHQKAKQQQNARNFMIPDSSKAVRESQNSFSHCSSSS